MYHVEYGVVNKEAGRQMPDDLINRRRLFRQDSPPLDPEALLDIQQVFAGARVPLHHERIERHKRCTISNHLQNDGFKASILPCQRRINLISFEIRYFAEEERPSQDNGVVYGNPPSLEVDSVEDPG